MGSLFKPDIPAPPPPPPPATFRDEVGGTEQVPIKNPDGTITYITRELPKSAEQQARDTEFKRIMKESLDEIERLSSEDFADEESVKNVLESFKIEQGSLVEDAFDDRARAEEATLARRGLLDSSAATGARRQRRLDKLEAEQSIGRQADLIKDDIRANRIGLQQNLFNVASSRQDVASAKKLQSSAQGFNNVSSLNAFNRASVLDSFNANLRASQVSGPSPLGLFASAALPSAGTSIGKAFGGLFS